MIAANCVMHFIAVFCKCVKRKLNVSSLELQVMGGEREEVECTWSFRTVVTLVSENFRWTFLGYRRLLDQFQGTKKYL